VPVGSAFAHQRLVHEVDESICLASPEIFFAVGTWYVNFAPVSDSEVKQILTRFAS
jgi:predicted phosphoribosyltransferase